MTVFGNPLDNENDSFMQMFARIVILASRSEGRKFNGRITEARAEASRRKLDGSTGGSKSTHTHTHVYTDTRAPKNARWCEHLCVCLLVCLFVFVVCLIASLFVA